VAFLNWRLGLTQLTAWRIEVAPVPGLSNVATPKNLSSPSPHLYMDMGMVMIREKGSREMVRWAGAWGEQGRQSAMQIRNPECLLLLEHLLLLLLGFAIPLGFERPVFSGHLLLRLHCPYATPPFLFP
jgi:hypothetical protein